MGYVKHNVWTCNIAACQECYEIMIEVACRGEITGRRYLYMANAEPMTQEYFNKMMGKMEPYRYPDEPTKRRNRTW